MSTTNINTTAIKEILSRRDPTYGPVPMTWQDAELASLCLRIVSRLESAEADIRRLQMGEKNVMADEIERLRKENETLRKALERIRDDIIYTEIIKGAGL